MTELQKIRDDLAVLIKRVDALLQPPPEPASSPPSSRNFGIQIQKKTNGLTVIGEAYAFPQRVENLLRVLAIPEKFHDLTRNIAKTAVNYGTLTDGQVQHLRRCVMLNGGTEAQLIYVIAGREAARQAVGGQR